MKKTAEADFDDGEEGSFFTDVFCVHCLSISDLREEDHKFGAFPLSTFDFKLSAMGENKLF